MKEEHWKHLGDLQRTFIELSTDKYVKGQNEHGGELWSKTGLIDMAIDEAIDQVVYLLTLKQQLESHES